MGWGRGAFGNRRLTAVLEVGWWLAGLGLGAFVPPAVAALAWRVVEDPEPGGSAR